MKTFFATLLIVIGIFFYIFAPKSTVQEPITLEQIDEQELIEEAITVKNFSIDAYEEPPKFIPQNYSFNEIKNIIQDIKNIKYKENITLNSKVSSFIYTKEDQEKFKNALSSSFGVSHSEINKEYKKRELIWDWVNYLKSR